jgi:transposase
LSKHLLPLIPSGLSVLQVVPDRDRIIIHARPRQTGSCCPDCATPSHQVHSRYQRTLADLPWQGRPVSLRVQARRFFCSAADCTRRTFSERLPDVVRPSARRSVRLADIQRHLGLALGGEAGARLARRLAMSTSADTLLRLVGGTGSIERGAVTPRVLGIDEWAWRRGRRYGTILVDLERNRVVDLLPDRQADTVAAWLRDHPGVEVVARDRADVYADGVRRGAPDAVHVLDRWHLLRNLGEAVQAIVGRHHAAIRTAAREVVAELAVAAHADRLATVKPTAAQSRSRQRHARWQARYEEAARLRAAGASISCIARTVGADPKTVRGWLRNGGPPSWQKPPRPTVLDPYRSSLEQRWREGCRNAAALWRELVGLGFEGRSRVVRAWATEQRRQRPAAPDNQDADVPAGVIWKPPSITRATRLVQADPATLAAPDRAFTERLLAHVDGLGEEIKLASRLGLILRKESQEDLDDWLNATEGTALATFATGLRKDLAAVKAALALPWTTGPVEGQINRLKMVKRTMYGRAGFQLLRHRVLEAA